MLLLKFATNSAAKVRIVAICCFSNIYYIMYYNIKKQWKKSLLDVELPSMIVAVVVAVVALKRQRLKINNFTKFRPTTRLTN